MTTDTTSHEETAVPDTVNPFALPFALQCPNDLRLVWDEDREEVIGSELCPAYCHKTVEEAREIAISLRYLAWGCTYDHEIVDREGNVLETVPFIDHRPKQPQRCCTS